MADAFTRGEIQAVFRKNQMHLKDSERSDMNFFLSFWTSCAKFIA